MALAVARPGWDFSPPDRPLAALARALADRGRWTPRDDAGRAAGLRGAKLADAIARAEASGLVGREERASGVWLKLTRLGEGLFPATAPAPGRRVMADELGDPPEVDDVLAELASMPTALVLAEDLAARMGQDVMPLWEALEAARRGGWAETWPDAPRGPSAILSGLSAARLGLVLASDGSRWLRDGEPDPTAIDGPLGVATETDCSPEGEAGRFSWTADADAPEAIDALLAIEEAGRKAATYLDDLAAEEAADLAFQAELRARRGRRGRTSPREFFERVEAGDFAPRPEPTIPRPTLLLGINRPWPVYSSSSGARDYHRHDGPCPECGGHQLAVAAVCLVCLRSGVDHLLVCGTTPTPDGPEDAPREAGITVPDRFKSMAEWLE